MGGRVERSGLEWCGAGEEGRVGVDVGLLPEDGGKLGGVKIEHKNSGGV